MIIWKFGKSMDVSLRCLYNTSMVRDILDDIFHVLLNILNQILSYLFFLKYVKTFLISELCEFWPANPFEFRLQTLSESCKYGLEIK